jgi:hypothetical protein
MAPCPLVPTDVRQEWASSFSEFKSKEWSDFPILKRKAARYSETSVNLSVRIVVFFVITAERPLNPHIPKFG